MSLATDKCIHSNEWVEFPITNQVITKIYEYAKQDDRSHALEMNLSLSSMKETNWKK